MEFIKPIFSIATKLYSCCEKVKANKKQCCRLGERVKGLEQLVHAIDRGGGGNISADVVKALHELNSTLEGATVFVTEHCGDHFLKRMFLVNNHREKFETLNNHLSGAYQLLSQFLQVEDHHALHKLDTDIENLTKLFEESSRRAQDEADRNEDDMELKKLAQLMDAVLVKQNAGAEKLDAVLVKQDAGAEKLDAVLVKQDAGAEKLDAVLDEVQDIKQMIGKLPLMVSTTEKKSEVIPKDIREIKLEELRYDCPKVLIQKTEISEVYKGEYNKYPVAIKKYTCPTTSPSEVRGIFSKETETMKKFDSTNILRLFGICIQEKDGVPPIYLIVMEYCEMGSLRQVLEEQCDLSWYTKARMCLGATRGIYSLHHTGEKAKVHGCINSDKFLVAEGYVVKLGGLELAQTETSLRQNVKDPWGSIPYRSPEQMQSIKHAYCKECEMYSLGIILWEIATLKKPFEDCSSNLKEIYDRVCKKKLIEPLPEDCPEQLGEQINACRAYDIFQRPTAGDLVDKLQKVVEQLKEQDQRRRKKK